VKFQVKKPRKSFFLFLVGGWLILLALLNFTSARDIIAYRFATVLQYHARDWLGKTPPVSDKLKIFAIDDSTFSYLGGPTPSNETWAKVLTNIADRKPKTILIDSLFSSNAERGDERYIDQIRDLDVPIYSGAYVKFAKINERYELPLDRPNQFLSRYMAPGASMSEEALPFLTDMQERHVYGHSGDFEGAFFAQGHLVYNKTDWTVPLFLRLAPDRILPHLAVDAADRIQFRYQEMYIDGIRVPFTRKGSTAVNHRPPKMFYKKSRPLLSAIKNAYKGKEEKWIQPGDVVLIISMFTGGTDFHEGGPFGEIPGGFIQAATVDTILSGNWIDVWDFDTELLVLFSLLGMACGYYSGPVRFWSLSVGCLGLYLGVATYSFSFWGILVPWALPLFGFMGSGAIINSQRFLQNQMEKVVTEKNLLSEKAKRLEEENKRVALQESLALGKAVQDLLLPERKNGRFGSYEYHTLYTPSQVMSGDWLFVWRVSPKEERIFVGDVMGKGPSAALPVAIIIGVLAECRDQNLSTEESLAKINDRLVRLFRNQVSSTAAAIVITGETITVYNAGGPGWILVKSGDLKFEPMRTNPLGISPSVDIKPVTLNRKDMVALFTFTDGYLEGGRAMRRLAKYFKLYGYPTHVDQIHQALIESGHNARLEDDRTLLLVKSA
jgi:serine phosphatase RsbU (regulator of sigma subunit)